MTRRRKTYTCPVCKRVFHTMLALAYHRKDTGHAEYLKEVRK